MKTTNTKAQPKPSFWTWFHKNRVKIGIITFIVVVPLALLLSVYIGAYVENNKVHFDQVLTEDTTFVKDFIKVNPSKLDVNDENYLILDMFDDFDIFIKWEELYIPYINPNTSELDYGSYRFKMYYTASESSDVSYVNVTPLLQTPWTSIRSIGNSTGLGTSEPTTTNIYVSYNYKMPVTPLPLVNVESPYLYLRVTYGLTVGDTTETASEYLRIDLNNIDPWSVYPLP